MSVMSARRIINQLIKKKTSFGFWKHNKYFMFLCNLKEEILINANFSDWCNIITVYKA